MKHSTEHHKDEQPIPQSDYWQKRCEAAENYIDLVPCDPDIVPEQLKTYRKWQQLKSSPSPTPVNDEENELDSVEKIKNLVSEIPSNWKGKAKERLVNKIIAFAAWYSGTEKSKVENAYKRYLEENPNSTPVQEGLREDEKENQGN